MIEVVTWIVANWHLILTFVSAILSLLALFLHGSQAQTISDLESVVLALSKPLDTKPPEAPKVIGKI